MRRTTIGVLALTCTAVLASAGPALADGGTATPSPVSTGAPTERPGDSPAEAPSPVPSTEPTRAPAEDQVSAVPSGAPDTGVTAGSDGSDAGLIGGGAAVVLGGGALFLVRRRRATGA
ncbi:sortase-dependent protein [Streptomyces sp. NPDC000983]|uniref:sortase-dependent protein n=1 Tax=Streptomyces sp. NPDC000983 TaxID=3154373 RepID=UPI0033218F4D